ncbi:hypothetical protein [Sphaerospermopsis sp. LEGE 08334]|uniref:hypothetical protein n=1 Tax=Sphaerospermopsis sp. LEGE 08334 TaxID=1828651 RepID=UPI001D148D41|nr:hypothetical protein [Sphaerospermopsis sp. LEGE 08334]
MLKFNPPPEPQDLEHFLSCENHRHLAYEWTNYRFVSGWVNSSKGTLDNQVLDPFEVEDDWFEILLTFTPVSYY